MTGENRITYTYFNKDIFNNKLNYSYSKFGGIEFLESWAEKRKECIDILLDSTDLCYEIIDNSKTNIEFEKWLSTNAIFSEIDKVHLLIKRFEVTKRIYELYDDDYRRVNKDIKYNNLNLYINFGFVMVKLYDKYNHLQYMNSLLKLVDIVCSRVYELRDKEELARYGAAIKLIKEEKKIIAELCKNKNIDL